MFCSRNGPLWKAYEIYNFQIKYSFYFSKNDAKIGSTVLISGANNEMQVEKKSQRKGGEWANKTRKRKEKKHKPRNVLKTVLTSVLLLFALPSQPSVVVMGKWYDRGASRSQSRLPPVRFLIISIASHNKKIHICKCNLKNSRSKNISSIFCAVSLAWLSGLVLGFRPSAAKATASNQPATDRFLWLFFIRKNWAGF